MKVSCTVWIKGKGGDDVKALPIDIISVALMGVMLSLEGMGNMTKKCIQIVAGIGIAVGAASGVAMLTGTDATTISGCLF